MMPICRLYANEMVDAGYGCGYADIDAANN